MKQVRKRIGSLLLSVGMVLTMLPTVAFAEEGVQDSSVPSSTSKITTFADLAEDVFLQEVESGTTVDELNLPNTLTATVTTGPAFTEAVSGDSTATDSEAQEPESQQEETTVDVSGWTADPAYDGDTEGEYIFTPSLILSEGLSLTDGVMAPQITVTVTEPTAPVLNKAETQRLSTPSGNDITASFIDPNFLAEVRKELGKGDTEPIYDTDDFDSVTTLNLIMKKISSLAGIEHFTGLTELQCSINSLTELDLSQNTALTKLSCAMNKLDELDVSQNTALTELSCTANRLTELDVSNNTELTVLNCGKNQLTTLDVSNNRVLSTLDCPYNELAALNVTNNTALAKLNCTDNYMADKNAVTGLNESITTSFTFEPQRSATGTNITSDFTDLNFLAEVRKALRKGEKAYIYDTDDFASVTSLDVSNKDIKSLEGIAYFTELTDLNCSGNWLTALDVSANIGLITLNCSDNYMADKNAVIGLNESITTNLTFDPQNMVGECGANAKWYFNSITGVLTIKGQGEMENYNLGSEGTQPPWGGGVASEGFASDVKEIVIEDGITNIGSAAFKYCTAVKKITIPISVSSLGEGAFMYCSELTGITIPSSINNIPKDAFRACRKLPKITFHKYMNSIGQGAFIDCKSLSEITFEGAEAPELLDKLEFEFIGLPETGTLYYPNYGKNYLRVFQRQPFNTSGWEKILTGYEYSIHSDTGVFDIYAISEPCEMSYYFPPWKENMNSIKTVNINEKITSIGNAAFKGGVSLTDVTMTQDVTKIEREAFMNCTSLANISLSENVTVIYNKAFQSCSALTAINIPGSVTEIQWEVFSGCTSLNSITFEGSSVPSTGTDAFASLPVSGTIYCPENAVSNYETWKNNITDLANWEVYEDISSHPTITKQPTNVTVSKGGTATFTITADNAMSYQWYCSADNNDIPQSGNGKIINSDGKVSGATTATLTIYNVTENMDDATIWCTVYNSDMSKSAMSTMATLTVTPIPATITAVSVSPATANIQKGTTQQFNAAVSGTGSYDSSVTWTVEGASNAGTTISATGLLTVAADETATTLMVKATSVADNTKHNTAAVNVTDTAVTRYTLTVTNGTGSGDYEADTVISITVNPPTAGKQFKNWTAVGGGSFASASSAITAFTMPANAVTITANYEDIPASTKPVVVEDSYASTTGAGSYAKDASVNIYAGNRSNYSFSGWTVVSGGVTITNANSKNASFTMPNNAVTVKANWSYNGGGSGGGGSSSGGNTSTPTVTTPPTNTENPKPATEVTTIVKPTVSNGTVTATISTEAVNSAIAKAQAEAKKNGTTENGIVVEIQVDTKNTTAKNLTANLTKASVEALVKAGTKEVRIASEIANINVNLEALKEIQKQVGTDVTVTAKKVDNSTLSGDAKKLVGNRPVYDFSITGANGKNVTDFGKGSISVSIPYELGASENPANVAAYYIDSNGKVTEMPNSVYDPITKTLNFLTDHFSKFAVGYKPKSIVFTDITDHWAKESIEFVAARGLLAGIGNNKFSPNTSMTRGMFVTALGRLANADVSKYTKSSFTDVKSDAYYMSYIEWAVKNNIVKGIGDGKFDPDQSINREQMAVIMNNYAKAIGFDVPKIHAENAFSDNAQIASYAKDAVKAMQQAGIMTGGTSNKLNPKSNATRAEVSSILHRYIKLTIDN